MIEAENAAIVKCKNGCPFDWHWKDREESIKAWNTRKPMQNIVERLGEYEDEAAQLGVGGMLADMLEVVKEEGGINE